MLIQNKQEEYKKLIPLRRLAKEVPYKVTYLSLLVQRGKLRAEKIGRNYFTSREWFNEYLEMHARDEKIEKAEEGRTEKAEEKSPNSFTERGQELDLSVLEKADKKNEILSNWSEQADKEQENIISETKDASSFISVNNFFNEINSLVAKSWRKKLAVICYVGLVAAFSFSLFAPGASASFATMLDKTLSAPVEATQAMVRAAGEAVRETSRMIAQGPAGQVVGGRVAGTSEKDDGNSVVNSILAFADKTAEKGSEAWEAVKSGTVGIFEDLAQAQKDLSIKLNDKVAKLTVAGAGQVKGISETGGVKLASAFSNFYNRVVDFFTPDSLKEDSGQGEEAPETPEESPSTGSGQGTTQTSPPSAPVSTPKVTIPTPAKKSTAGTTSTTPGAKATTASPATIPAQIVVQPQTTVLSSSGGGTSVAGNLSVQGAATFNDNLTVDDNLTVKGVIYGGSPVEIAGGLKVSGNAEFT
ncbi:MAG: hypothetical protein WC619_06045, partial [Patescibacteria group bacterium]